MLRYSVTKGGMINEFWVLIILLLSYFAGYCSHIEFVNLGTEAFGNRAMSLGYLFLHSSIIIVFNLAPVMYISMYFADPS